MNLRNLLLGAACAVAAIAAATAAPGCKSPEKSKPVESNEFKLSEGEALVELHTTEGDIMVRLFADTPAHRDNFLRLAREGYYNGVLFHRVIRDFMVQTGDPDSKGAPRGKMLGSGGPDYTLPAEIVFPAHFHRRGALAAARQGDQQNPERRSSGSQFYIVTGQVVNDSTLAQMEQRMAMSQKQQIFNTLAAQQRDTIMTLRRNRDQVELQALQDELIQRTESIAAAHPATMTPEQRQAYATEGGAPHLDGQYTVFGEVVKGMDIVDRIQQAQTDDNDRPLDDIAIKSVTVHPTAKK